MAVKLRAANAAVRNQSTTPYQEARVDHAGFLHEGHFR
jgi:hypothetical protein